MSAILTILGRATRDPEMQQGKNSGTECHLISLLYKEAQLRNLSVALFFIRIIKFLQ